MATQPAQTQLSGGRRTKVTLELIQAISEMSARASQTEIAATLQCGVGLVGKIQRQFKIQRKPKAPELQTGFLKIRVSAAMVEMARLRGCCVENYLAQLADTDRAEIRKKDFPQHCFEKQPAPPIVAAEYRAVRIAAETVQKILHHLDEDLPVAAIATRHSVSRSSVRRIREERAQSAVRGQIPPGPRPHRGPFNAVQGRP
jgi:hypothetical protein